MESIRKSDNPQPVINIGDDVRVMVKKNLTSPMYLTGLTRLTRLTGSRSGIMCTCTTTNLMILKQCMGSATQTMICPATRNVSCDMSYYG